MLVLTKVSKHADSELRHSDRKERLKSLVQSATSACREAMKVLNIQFPGIVDIFTFGSVQLVLDSRGRDLK